jgi:cytochrome c oxidase assembly protein subunit 19
MVDAFGGSRVKIKPPEKGVFPLDHDGDCKAKMIDFLTCLKGHNEDYFPCREHSKLYLECRMNNNLMAKEDLNSLGFSGEAEYNYSRQKSIDVDQSKGNKESEGFVAGLGVRAGKKWIWK